MTWPAVTLSTFQTYFIMRDHRKAGIIQNFLNCHTHTHTYTHTRSCLSHQYTVNSHRTGGETSPDSSRRQIPRATDCQMFPSPTSVSLYMAANHRHQITLQTGMLIQVRRRKWFWQSEIRYKALCLQIRNFTSDF